MRWGAASVVFLGLAVSPPAAAQASSFDGKWNVTQECQGAPGGARGFTWRYDAIVKDGNLIGQYGTKGQPSSLTLTGKIQPDGVATLAATGLSGHSDYTAGFEQTGSRFSYPVSARFEAKRGTGLRSQGRTCTFTFVKQ
jgi:hypothetical protein